MLGSTNDVGSVVIHEGYGVRFVQISYLLLYDPNLNESQKMLYMMLCRFAGSTSVCFPGIRKLAKMMGVADRTVQTNMARLVEYGIVCREQRVNQSNVYRVIPPAIFYTDKDGLLKKWVIERFKEVGEHKIVEMIQRNRGELPFDESAFDDMGTDSGQGANAYQDPITEHRERGQAKERAHVEVRRGLVSSDKLIKTSCKSGDGIEIPERGVSDSTMGEMAKKVARANAYKDRKEQQKKRGRPPKVVPQPEDINTVNLDGIKPINTHDLYGIWVDEVTAKFGKDCKAVNWQPKDYKNMQRLIRQYGGKKIINLVREVVSRWDHYAGLFNFKGFPSVGILYSNARMWLDGSKDREFVLQSGRRKALEVGEYDEERARAFKKRHPKGCAILSETSDFGDVDPNADSRKILGS